MNLIKSNSTVFRRRKPTRRLSSVKFYFYFILQNVVVVVLVIVMCGCVIVTHYEMIIKTGCITISLRARQF